MASRFACIATSRRRRALTTSMSSHAVRTRRASASLRRAASVLPDLGDADDSRHDADRADAVRAAPKHNPPPAIVSRR